MSSTFLGLLALVEEQLGQPVGRSGAAAVRLVEGHPMLLVFLLLGVVPLQAGRVPRGLVLRKRCHGHAPDRVVGFRRGRRAHRVLLL